MNPRGELANLIAATPSDDPRTVPSPLALADAILAAGYHGPVRGERWEYAVRRNGITYPNVFLTADEARKWAEGFTARSTETEVVRRLVGPWEVA